MTDLEISVSIAKASKILSCWEAKRDESVIAIIGETLALIPKAQATQYFIKKYKAIVIDIPTDLLFKEETICAQLGVAVGRRLERFERGAKANATRTPNSRKKIAQNAIQTRWNAKS